jgi:signal transduction histidine kinase
VYFCALAALEHAGAGTEVTITIRDDERALAFEVTATPGGSDAELERLRDRVEALGGRLAISREPGGSTRLSGSVPSRGEVTTSRPGRGSQP